MLSASPVKALGTLHPDPGNSGLSEKDCLSEAQEPKHLNSYRSGIMVRLQVLLVDLAKKWWLAS